jgi:L-histidine N-alpha-methyltransferase
MQSTKTKSATYNPDLAKSVDEGLSAPPKYLSSKYFYDPEGDHLFQKIMDLPEYYLSKCEEEILAGYKNDLLQQMCEEKGEFSIVELGAGDGSKTKILLRYFLSENCNFNYVPVDISANAVEGLTKSLTKELPELKVNGLAKEYFAALKDLKTLNSRKLILFLGSSIGNFSKSEATDFLKLIRAQMSPRDLLLVGFDLKKDPDIIYKAYNDSQGVTKQFNFNLLSRINNELGGTFDLSQFIHYPSYDPSTGEMKSFLVSTKNQTVYIDALQKSFTFGHWESIFTEVSMKYCEEELQKMATDAGFNLLQFLTDKNTWYTDLLLSPAES